ncbi:hypothetical protein ACPXB3_22340, partial [Gordonia sp. DT219]|uniref:hypothetical protein n=1 Tax=Gordonia sp. DT219 TaxID=3416658 RepID=UPI003CF6F0C5
MPWSPDGPAVTTLTRQGWSVDGPDPVAVESRRGWWCLPERTVAATAEASVSLAAVARMSTTLPMQAQASVALPAYARVSASLPAQAAGGVTLAAMARMAATLGVSASALTAATAEQKLYPSSLAVAAQA